MAQQMHFLAVHLPTIFLWIVGILIGGFILSLFVLFPILLFIAVLLECHNSRLNVVPAKPMRFDRITVLPMLVQHDQEKMEAIVKRGLGRYIDAEHSSIRLNVSGALQMVFKGMAEVGSSVRRIKL